MTIAAADLAAIRDHIGDETPPTDETLGSYWDELLTVEAVALRVLRRRYAAMLGQAADFTAEGDYRESWAKNIDKLERKISELAAVVDTAADVGDFSVGVMTRADRCR